MKLIVDGSFIIQDESGQKVTAKPGDLFYFPKVSAITFSTQDFRVGLKLNKLLREHLGRTWTKVKDLYDS